MALQVEDVHHALPNSLPVEHLFDGQRFDQNSRSAVLALDGLLLGGGVYVDHGS